MNGMRRIAARLAGIVRRTTRQSIAIRSIYLLLLLLALPLLVWNGLVQQFNASLTDVLMRLRPPIRSREIDEIVLVAIDDATAARYGPLPLRRPVLAQGISVLSSFHPKALAVDILLAEAGRPEDDAALAKVLGSERALVLSAARLSDPQAATSWILPTPEFADSHLIGHVHAETDPDGNVRSILLEQAAGGKRYWALGFQAARAARSAGAPLETPQSVRLGSTLIPAPASESRRMLINYAGPEGVFRRISFSSLLDNTARPEDVRDKIVFLGATAQGSGDRLFTPVSSGIGMSGIEIHANVARTILDHDFLLPLGEPGEFALLALIVAAGAMGIGALRGIRLYGTLALLGVIVIVSCWTALHFGRVWPVGSLLVAFVVSGSVAGIGEYALVATALRSAERKQREYAFRVQAIAHEIKTPLTAIQGSSEIISDQQVPEDQRAQIAGMIHKESQRLTRIIHTFLDVERMAAGALSLEKRPVDLAVLCADVLERARLYAGRKKIAIEADVPHIVAAADADLLAFAVYNLLTNAVKYSPKQTTVSLTAEALAGSVRISVVDQGYGIAPGEQRKIFERFYRVRRGQSDNEEGAGIGLALVKEIVSQHGGQVVVDSREGAGSRFTIILPGRD